MRQVPLAAAPGWGISLSEGEATVIWPDPKEVGWGILLAGLILLLGKTVCGFVANYIRVPSTKTHVLLGLAGPDRMGILEFYKVAKDNHGWNFEDGSLDYDDLFYGLRKAGMYGDIRFWGKPHHHAFEDLSGDEVSVQIAAAHWLDYDFDLRDAIAADDNLYAGSCNKRDLEAPMRGGFADIHADRAELCRWLETTANTFRGHTKPRMRQLPRVSSPNLHTEEHLTL